MNKWHIFVFAPYIFLTAASCAMHKQQQLPPELWLKTICSNNESFENTVQLWCALKNTSHGIRIQQPAFNSVCLHFNITDNALKDI